jgi:hypothetical protein
VIFFFYFFLHVFIALKTTESSEAVNSERHYNRDSSESALPASMCTSNHIKTSPKLRKHSHDFSLTDTKNHRFSLHMLDKDAEERISNETEKVI